jgi:hypothetical protein
MDMTMSDKDTEDKRVVRTRKLIEQTLLTMISERGLKDLNVKNLTERANINRGTFYLHYTDIYDLIEQTEMMNGLLDIFKPLSLQQVREFNSEHTAFPAMIRDFEYLQEYAYFFKAIFQSSAPGEFGNKLRQLMGSHMYEELRQEHPALTTGPSDYLISYFGSGQFGLIQHWFNTDMRLPPSEVAMMLTRFLQMPPCLAKKT